MGLFVLEGSPVTLTTTQHHKREDIRNFKWLFNADKTIVYCTPKYNDVEVDHLYQGRVEFNVTDFSMTLKNPKKSDSGLYTAVMDTTNKTAETATSHELSVLGECLFYLGTSYKSFIVRCTE